jgi:hypothetical protein
MAALELETRPIVYLGVWFPGEVETTESAGGLSDTERVKSEVEERISPSRDQFEASRTWHLPDELTGYI